MIDPADGEAARLKALQQRRPGAGGDRRPEPAGLPHRERPPTFRGTHRPEGNPLMDAHTLLMLAFPIGTLLLGLGTLLLVRRAH